MARVYYDVPQKEYEEIGLLVKKVKWAVYEYPKVEDGEPSLWAAHRCNAWNNEWIMCEWDDPDLETMECRGCGRTPPKWATALIRLSW